MKPRRSGPGPLTLRQQNTLFVVSQNEPVSAAAIARHLLSDPDAERSRLGGLERRGLVTRQYTGLSPGDRLGWVLTAEGGRALDALDRDDDYDPLESTTDDPRSREAGDECGRPVGHKPDWMGVDQ